MTPKLARRRDGNPFASDQIVVATRTFATDRFVVHVGEKFRGGEPVVEENWTAFVDGDTLPQELPNFWHDIVPEPPQHPSRLNDTSIKIPAHRQVRSTVDVNAPMDYAPGSEGERLQSEGRMDRPPLGRTLLPRGQILDVLSDEVRLHPEWFRWPERDVVPDDIERLAKLAQFEDERVQQASRGK